MILFSAEGKEDTLSSSLIRGCFINHVVIYSYHAWSGYNTISEIFVVNGQVEFLPSFPHLTFNRFKPAFTERQFSHAS